MEYFDDVPSQRIEGMRGVMLGGALGDALGYPLERLSSDQILERYGRDGPEAPHLDEESGRSLISECTQLVLYTACAGLIGDTRLRLRGIGGPPSCYAKRCYWDWHITQICSYPPPYEMIEGSFAWLNAVPGMYCKRTVDGGTAEALGEWSTEEGWGQVHSQGSNPSNRGCCGAVRVAPVALLRWSGERGDSCSGMGEGDSDAREQGARLCRLTHGHPVGWLCGAVMVGTLQNLLHCPASPGEAALSAAEAVAAQYPEEAESSAQIINTLRQALDLAAGGQSDEACTAALGGRSAEKVLAVAVLCAQRHPDDFAGALRAAVCHGGSPAASGTLCGQIMGARLGAGALPGAWLDRLELAEVVRQIADDLAILCPCNGETWELHDEDWLRRYGGAPFDDYGEREPYRYRGYHVPGLPKGQQILSEDKT